jgi:hypothetical protein
LPVAEEKCPGPGFTKCGIREEHYQGRTGRGSLGGILMADGPAGRDQFISKGCTGFGRVDVEGEGGEGTIAMNVERLFLAAGLGAECNR